MMSGSEISFTKILKSNPKILTDIVGVMLIGLDTEGRIQFLNRKACEILEYDKDELIGLNWFDKLIPASSKKENIENFKRTLSGKRPIDEEFESIIHTKTGKVRTIKCVGRVLKDSEDNIAGVLKSGEDITLYKIIQDELRKNEKRFRSLFNRVPIGLYRTNRKGQFLEANPALVKMLNYPNREVLVNTNINDIFVDKKTRSEELKILEKEDKLNYQIDLYRYDRSIIHVNDRVRSIKNIEGKVIYYEGSLEDITEKVIAEGNLKENEQKLIEINAEKDKFFSIVAHDLKSAFNSMLGFSDLLIKNFDEYTQSKKKKFIDIIQQNILNTYKLLENLLVWSRAQRGIIEFNPEDHNLYLLILETIDIVKQAAENKSISIENCVPEEMFIRADKNMVLTILRNLLNNAVKFTPSEGKIVIDCDIIIGSNGKKDAKISVKDTGIGIKEDSLKKLFTLSESLSTKGTENEPGTGLGLILCKDFVEKHGGEMNVRSKVGIGSTFVFTLPFDRM